MLGRVVVTRAATQAQPLITALAQHGFEPIAWPVLTVGPAIDGGAALRSAIRQGFDVLLLASANALHACIAAGLQPRVKLQIAVIGYETKRIAESLGFSVALVPEHASAEDLAQLVLSRVAPQARLFLPQAHNARPLLLDTIAAAGRHIQACEAYRTADLADPTPLPIDGVRAVSFASSATVQRFMRLAGPGRIEALRAQGVVWAAIGAQTAKTLAAHGFKPVIQAAVADSASLAQCIADYLLDSNGAAKSKG